MKKHLSSKRKIYKRRSAFVNFFYNNINYFAIVSIIFIIGIIIGVIILNNLPNTELSNIKTFLDSSILKLKESKEFSRVDLLKDSIIKNIYIIIIAWLLGTTFFGRYLLYNVTMFFGIYFGYMVSSIIISLTLPKAMLFLLTGVFLHSIIKIFTIILLNVFGVKLHTDLIPYNNYKVFLVKYSFGCFFCLLLLIASSGIEVFVSENLLIKFLKFL